MSDKQLSFLQLLNASHLNASKGQAPKAPPTAQATPVPPPPPPALPALLAATGSRRLTEFLPAFWDLKRQITADAQACLLTLPALNSSRRKLVLQYFAEIVPSSLPEAALASALAVSSTADQSLLREWVLHPKSDAQRQALDGFAEDLALLWLGSALVLKSWADRGIRPLDPKDLSQVNWALSAALKPHLPLDREPWQITRQNIFSWFNPSAESQRAAGAALQSLSIGDEGPQFLAHALQLRRNRAGAQNQYDPRWFQAFWKAQGAFGFDLSQNFRQGMISRKWRVFSPTLGSGTLDMTAPATVDLMGVESQTFAMMAAELARLWWGPATPPLWAVGRGLEVLRASQADMIGPVARHSTQDRLTDMEAVDLAVVIEPVTERPVRLPESTAATLKPFRAQGTSLGALQTIVAFSKLKPGGLLWWFREEPLGPHEGQGFLKGLLDRGAILEEIDLSGLEHSLPSHERLYPRYVYCLRREGHTDGAVEQLGTHRPHLIQIQGNLRSHVELPLLYGGVFQPPGRPVDPGLSSSWTLHARLSPSPQSDWIDHWPTATSQKALLSLEALRERSEPLGQWVMIRNFHAGANGNSPKALASDDVFKASARQNSLAKAICGFIVKTAPTGGGLVATPLSEKLPLQNDGFLVACPDPRWVAPLAAYLESPWVALWLEHFAEHKRGRVTLKDTTLKLLPVPKILVQALTSPPPANPAPEWIRLATKSAYQPDLAREELASSPLDPLARTTLYVETSQTLKDLEASQSRLEDLMANGRIRWRKVMELLPEREVSPFPVHPEFRISGQLPPHLAISKWNRVKNPLPGLSLVCEAGFQASITLQSSQTPEALMDILVEQIAELQHPTWSELVQFLRVPRQMDYARAFAEDILRSHDDQTRRIKALRALLNDCLSL